jgi:hypothetical protein
MKNHFDKDFSPVALQPNFGPCPSPWNFAFYFSYRSRTVGRTPWTGDELVARPLLTATGDCGDGEVCGMNDFGRGNWSTRRKLAPTPLCPPQITFDQTRAQNRAAALGSQRLTAWAMTRPPRLGTWSQLFRRIRFAETTGKISRSSLQSRVIDKKRAFVWTCIFETQTLTFVVLLCRMVPFPYFLCSSRKCLHRRSACDDPTLEQRLRIVCYYYTSYKKGVPCCKYWFQRNPSIMAHIFPYKL